jgi:hypothetical protein
VATDRVELPDDRGVLELHDASALRDGNLTSTALRSIPIARCCLPRALTNAHETKWVARGRFTNSQHASTGWAVHEVVRWA